MDEKFEKILETAKEQAVALYNDAVEQRTLEYIQQDVAPKNAQIDQKTAELITKIKERSEKLIADARARAEADKAENIKAARKKAETEVKREIGITTETLSKLLGGNKQ